MTANYKRVISILGHDIPLGTSKEINFNIAKLHTATIIEVPVIIEPGHKKGAKRDQTISNTGPITHQQTVTTDLGSAINMVQGCQSGQHWEN
mgnify:CR=1 FL=1